MEHVPVLLLLPKTVCMDVLYVQSLISIRELDHVSAIWLYMCEVYGFMVYHS